MLSLLVNFCVNQHLLVRRKDTGPLVWPSMLFEVCQLQLLSGGKAAAAPCPHVQPVAKPSVYSQLTPA